MFALESVMLERDHVQFLFEVSPEAIGIRSDERGEHISEPSDAIICSPNSFMRCIFVVDGPVHRLVSSCWNHRFRSYVRFSTKSSIMSYRSSKHRVVINVP